MRGSAFPRDNADAVAARRAGGICAARLPDAGAPAARAVAAADAPRAPTTTAYTWRALINGTARVTAAAAWSPGRTARSPLSAGATNPPSWRSTSMRSSCSATTRPMPIYATGISRGCAEPSCIERIQPRVTHLNAMELNMPALSPRLGAAQTKAATRRAMQLAVNTRKPRY